MRGHRTEQHSLKRLDTRWRYLLNDMNGKDIEFRQFTGPNLRQAQAHRCVSQCQAGRGWTRIPLSGTGNSAALPPVYPASSPTDGFVAWQVLRFRAARTSQSTRTARSATINSYTSLSRSPTQTRRVCAQRDFSADRCASPSSHLILRSRGWEATGSSSANPVCRYINRMRKANTARYSLRPNLWVIPPPAGGGLSPHRRQSLVAHRVDPQHLHSAFPAVLAVNSGSGTKRY